MENTKTAPTIELCPCESSRISHHGFDEATGTLALRFKGKEGKPGPLYHYRGVTKPVYADLCKAESLGKFFGSVIQSKNEKGELNYPFTRIEEEKPEAAT